jgi:hypothetical protein
LNRTRLDPQGCRSRAILLFALISTVLPIVACHQQADSPRAPIATATPQATSAEPSSTPQQTAYPAAIEVSIEQPASDARIACSHGSDGGCHFEVQGKSTGVFDRNWRLLLWIRPVQPPGDGWYLQKPPLNGIDSVAADGTWQGTAQIGSLQWPAHEGDLIDIATTVENTAVAASLLDSSEIIVRPQPTGQARREASSVVIERIRP